METPQSFREWFKDWVHQTPESKTGASLMACGYILLAGGALVALDEFHNHIVKHIEDSFALLASTTEAKACLHAVWWCVDRKIKTVCIYTDSQVLINELPCGSAEA
ncbi:unnamed protein product [Camellia sinensis]